MTCHITEDEHIRLMQHWLDEAQRPGEEAEILRRLQYAEHHREGAGEGALRGMSDEDFEQLQQRGHVTQLQLHFADAEARDVEINLKSIHHQHLSIEAAREHLAAAGDALDESEQLRYHNRLDELKRLAHVAGAMYSWQMAQSHSGGGYIKLMYDCLEKAKSTIADIGVTQEMIDNLTKEKEGTAA